MVRKFEIALSFIIFKCVKLTHPTPHLFSAFRTWEDTTGKFKIEGKFHNLQNENLILLQVNGGTKSIPISKLSQKDQDFVKMMAASAVAQSDCETPAINNTSEFSPIPRGAQTVIRSAPPPPIPVSSPAATVRNQRPPPPPPPATASPASQTMRGAPPPIPSSHASQIMRAIPSTSSPFTRGSSRESISSIEGGIQKSTPPQTELDLSDSRSSGSIMSSRPSIANITSTGSPVTPLPVQFATSTASSTANANTTLRVWQDVSGKFKIEASYSSSNNGDVMLKQTNGVIITIPITKLCQADSDYIMNHLSLSLSGAAAESKLNSVAPLLKLASTSIGSTDSLSRAQEGYSFEDIDNHSHPADLIDPHIYINARKHWTENSGQGRSVEGFYHGFAWGKVLIKTTQGKLKGIPLKSLCNEDMEIVKAILYGKPITVGAASNNIPALPSAAIEPKLRVWEDSTGKFKIDAIYQSTENGVVFLKQHPSGAILKVPRSKLRQSDLEYIDSLNGCSIVPPRQASQDSLNRSNNSGSPATPPSAIPSSRIWQDASGKFKIEGTFKETSNGNVVIKQTNGAILTVPISKLCFTDAEYILNLKEKEKQLAKEAKLYSERELHAVQVIEKFARTYLDCRVARKERVRLLEEKAKNEMKQEQEKKAAAARLIDEQEKEQARLEQERKTELAREWEEKMQREREEKSRLEAALAQVEEEKKRMADLLAAQELKAAAVTVSPITAAASNSSNFASSTSAIPTTVSLNQQSLETLRTSNPAAYNFWMDNFLVPDPVDKDTFLTALEIHTGQEISLPMIKTSMVEPRIFKMLVSGKGPLVPHFQN